MRFSRKEEPAAVGHQWTMGSQLASVATSALLWLAIALSPVGFAVAMWAVSHPASVVPASGLSAESQAEQLVAGEFATRTITVWLGAARGQEDLVHALLPGSSALPLPLVGMDAADAMPVAYSRSGDGVWSVTVAVTVTDARMVSRRFFVLPVKVTGSLATAVAMPAEVPSTAVAAAAPELDYSVTVRPGSPVGATVAEFLAAYLTGVGDVSRVVTPKVPIVAVQPAPFSAVQISAIAAHSEVSVKPADGTCVDVLVTAVASVGDRQQITVQYPLVLAARAGRWEVAQVRQSPLLATKQPSAVLSPVPVTAYPPPVTPSTSSTQM